MWIDDMLNSRTVFIVGAGASVPYGFPSGWQLLADVAKATRDPDSALFGKLRHCGHDDDVIQAFGNALWWSGQLSIDAFLECNPAFDEIGKQAIAAALIPYEDPNRVFDTEPKDNWLRYLLHFLLVRREDFERSQLTIVTFNYDRLIEFFVHNSVKHNYNASDTEARELARRIDVLHLHGQLGPFSADSFRTFSPRATTSVLKDAAAQIEIIHQANERAPNFIIARERIQLAEQIVFLGFGYHRANLARLGFTGTNPANRAAKYGSTYGMGNGERITMMSLLPGFTLGDNGFACVDYLKSLPIGKW